METRPRERATRRGSPRSPPQEVAFADAQIGPYTQEVGITSPPKTEFYEIHNHLTAG